MHTSGAAAVSTTNDDNTAERSRHSTGDLLLCLVTVVAALGWIFSKEALQGVPPLLFIGLRFLLAGAVLLLARWNSFAQMSRSQLWRAAGVGLVLSAALLFWIHGLAFAKHLGEGAFINSLAVVLVPPIAFVITREKPSRETAVAMSIACLGLAMLFLKHGFHVELGQVLFLGSALCFATHFVYNTRAAKLVPALPLTAAQLLVVGAVALAWSTAVETWPTHYEPAIIGWVVASALIATSGRFALQTYGQSFAPANHSAVIMTLEPVWTASIAVYWFGEGMTALQLSGCALIFAGILASRWSVIRRLVENLRATQNSR